MKPHFKIIFILLAQVALWSCERINQPYPNRDYIIIGDRSNTVYRDFKDSTLMTDSPSSKSCTIDIDQDGINDIKLKAWLLVSPGGSFSNGSSITSLNDSLSIYTYESKDTLFYHYHSESWQIYSPNMTVVSYYYLYSCRQKDTSYTITKISDTKELSICKLNDTLSADYDFTSGEFRMYEPPNYLEENYIGENEDTIWVSYYGHDSNCANIPNQPVYLGLKIENKEQTKLGWIKLESLGGNGLIIYETAIQE